MVKLLMVCPPLHIRSDQPIVMLMLCVLIADGRPRGGGATENVKKRSLLSIIATFDLMTELFHANGQKAYS